MLTNILFPEAIAPPWKIATPRWFSWDFLYTRLRVHSRSFGEPGTEIEYVPGAAIRYLFIVTTHVVRKQIGLGLENVFWIEYISFENRIKCNIYVQLQIAFIFNCIFDDISWKNAIYNDTKFNFKLP